MPLEGYAAGDATSRILTPSNQFIRWRCRQQDCHQFFCEHLTNHRLTMKFRFIVSVFNKNKSRKLCKDPCIDTIEQNPLHKGNEQL